MTEGDLEQLFTFPARIDGIADHAREVIAALGDGFGGALVLAAIHEALVNAVVYGALRIPPPTAARDLDDLLARIRIAEAAHPRERIEASIASSDQDRVVSISDPGPGFDWRAWLRSGRGVVAPSISWSNVPTHGRGLVIMQAGSQGIWWNESGNQVSMRFHPTDVPVRKLARAASGPRPAVRVDDPLNRRLLVVSRDTASRVGLRHVLQVIGYDVRECDDPEEAPALIDSWAPGLVLVHVPLADDGGYVGLLRRIAALRVSSGPIPIAFVTSRVGPGKLSDTLASGALDVLELPMWRTDLERRLQSAIAATRDDR